MTELSERRGGCARQLGAPSGSLFCRKATSLPAYSGRRCGERLPKEAKQWQLFFTSGLGVGWWCGSSGGAMESPCQLCTVHCSCVKVDCECNGT